MTTDSGRRGRATGLTDRYAERGALDRLMKAVRAGEGRALVVRGDPGVGKTVLLEYLAGRAADSGCRVARAMGVQSEMELAFAGLHQLCARVRDLIVAETLGNPLALLELPRGLTPAELAGGFGLPGAAPLTGRIEDSFRRQLDALPAETQRLLQLAGHRRDGAQAQGRYRHHADPAGGLHRPAGA